MVLRPALTRARDGGTCAQGCVLDQAWDSWRAASESGRPASAEALRALGHTEARGRPDDAIARLRVALELDGDDPEILNNLGYLLGIRGGAVEAEELLRRARRLAPAWPLPCFNLADLLGRIGRAEEAEAVAASCPRTGTSPVVGRTETGR